MANLIKPHPKRPKKPNQNKVVKHHILLNSGEKASVGDVVGFIEK
jgi:hypothetical protein